jgi:cell division septation protein DedD
MTTLREQETMAVRDNDTEITLGLGKLLGLFFGLVILCGISLGIGYSLGRSSARQATADPANAPSAPAVNPAASATNKPGASQVSPPKTPDCAPGENCSPQPAPAPNTTDLTFYQSVQQKDAHPQLTPQTPQQAQPTAPSNPAEAHGTTLGTGYLVQIAAVRTLEDAKMLSETLRKQQFPVIIAQPGDKLFHVQVGPYADIKEAEAIRSRLVSAGYTPFLKR